MKILFVSPYTDFGCPTPYIQSQVNSVKKQGLNITEFHLKGRGVLAYGRFFFKLRYFLKSREFDIIHAHFGYIAFIVYLLAPGTKLVISFMGEDLYGRLNNHLKQTFQGRFNIVLSKFLQSKVDWIIVKSNHMFSYIRPEYKAKSSVIPNGVDFETFPVVEQLSAKARLGLDPRKKHILFLGKRSMVRKNFKLVHDAVTLLNNEDVHLIAPYPIQSDTVHLYLNACDVLAFSSLEEGSPNVIKEAIVCNCPIVSTNVGDVAERIHGIQGCFLSEYDPEHFMLKIREALAFNTRTNGREVLNYLNTEKVAHSLVNIYYNIANKRVNDPKIQALF